MRSSSARLDQPARLVVRRRTEALLRWYASYRRAWPWRSESDPYRIWVSEVLLQQTRVGQAAPFYERFVRAFPTVEALARAPRRRVLKLWQGAGYYARARHLHAAARRLLRERAGALPTTVEELEALPGVGPYIARAIASLAFGVPVIALEANGLRVAARWVGERRDPRRPAVRRRLVAELERGLDYAPAGPLNEAIMELGETVCLARRPRCTACPVRRFCTAYRTLPSPDALPHRPSARRRPLVRAAVVVLEDRGRLWLQRRPPTGFLGGLWEFPGGQIRPGETPEQAAARELFEETGARARSLRWIGTVRHDYSHRSVELWVYRGRVGRAAPRRLGREPARWVPRRAVGRLELPKATEKIVRLLDPALLSPADPPSVSPYRRRPPNFRPTAGPTTPRGRIPHREEAKLTI